jgi:hypothetical protein
MPCQSALSAAMLASDELSVVPVEPPYMSVSSSLVVEPEASASACWTAELSALADDVLELLDALELLAEVVDAGAVDASVVAVVGSVAVEAL